MILSMQSGLLGRTAPFLLLGQYRHCLYNRYQYNFSSFAAAVAAIKHLKTNVRAASDSHNSTDIALTTQSVASRSVTLPYFVERTAVGMNLPVYSDFKSGRTRTSTVIKKIYGDIDALAADLRSVFKNESDDQEIKAENESHQEGNVKHLTPSKRKFLEMLAARKQAAIEDRIVIKKHLNVIHVKGLEVASIKKFLESKGF